MPKWPVLFVCAIGLLAGRAEAQKAKYVSSGTVLEVPPREATTPTTSESVRIKGVNLGVGFPLGKASLEFLGVWHSAETDIDRDGEIALTETRVRNRDIPIVAAIRWAPDCAAMWCAEASAGFGINFSRRSLTRIGNCGTVQQPSLPCAPVSVELSPVNKEDPTVFIGGAATVRVLRRLDIGPSFKLWYVRRYRDKTPGFAGNADKRRTPDDGRLEIGFTVVWHLRRN